LPDIKRSANRLVGQDIEAVCLSLGKSLQIRQCRFTESLLSASIAPKQHFLTAAVTAKLARPDTKSPVFKCLYMLETNEWE